jgi:hypothetical protein
MIFVLKRTGEDEIGVEVWKDGEEAPLIKHLITYSYLVVSQERFLNGPFADGRLALVIKGVEMTLLLETNEMVGVNERW